MTSAGLLCTAASQPLVTSLAVVWIPIIVFTVITGSDRIEIQSFYKTTSSPQNPIKITHNRSRLVGFMMRNVLVRDRNDPMMTFADSGSGDERTNIMINMDAETLQNLLGQKMELSRFYDSQRDNFNRISF